MHGKQTWNKGSGQDYNNMIYKVEVHVVVITIKRGLQHIENDGHLKKQL